jgi:hypothetical protein
VAADDTIITGYVTHGVNRAIGDGFKRAGTSLKEILGALKNPLKITSGVDKFGRPYTVFTGPAGRVVVNPSTGKIISTNPLSGAGVRSKGQSHNENVLDKI